MSKIPSLYPDYDGSSPSRPNTDGNVLHVDRGPDRSDWDQMVAEMIAVQNHLKTVGAGQIQTVFANDAITNGGLLQNGYENINALTINLTLSVPGNIFCQTELLIQPNNTHWTSFGLQFSLDGTVFSPDSLVWFAEVGTTNNERRRVGIHFPFLAVAAGPHVIKVLGYAENSGQQFNITDRRLTVQY
jgi:hypothetical protein